MKERKKGKNPKRGNQGPDMVDPLPQDLTSIPQSLLGSKVSSRRIGKREKINGVELEYN